jgi:hypothetical protein
LKFKTHLQQIATLLVSSGTSSHVPFLNMEAYYSYMATFHDETLGDLKASLKV